MAWSSPKRCQFLPGDLQGRRLLGERRLGLQERLAGDDALLIEDRALVKQLAGQTDLGLGLEQRQLQRLPVRSW